MRLNVVVAAGPKPPVVANTKGVNDAISTSRTRWSYVRRFVLSCRRYTVLRLGAWFERALGLKIRTSKNAHSNRPPHRPLALMSSLAAGSRFADRCAKVSPLNGCSRGSTSTSWQISLRRLAVRSRSSLWRTITKPPFWHDKACEVSKLSPQAQWLGMFSGSHPYRRAMASRNAPLWRAKPCSSTGRVESQVEAPDSCARRTACCNAVGRSVQMASQFEVRHSCFAFRAALMARRCAHSDGPSRSSSPSSLWLAIISTMSFVTV